MTQTYEAWRITYQSSEQAARAAFERMMELEQGKCLHQIAEPAAPQAVQAAVRDGWKTVPINPTLEMMVAAKAHMNMRESFRAMMAAAPSHPAEGVPATTKAKMPADPTEEMIEVLMAGEDRLRARHGDELPKQRAKARYHALLALAATQPAAQAVPVLYVSKGQLDNHRDPDGVDTDGAGRYLPARKTPKGNFTAPLYEHPAPAAQGMDAEDAARYRFIKKHHLILSGGTREFGWPISPFGHECDRYIDKELAAQAKQGGA